MANRAPHRPSGRVDVNATARAIQAINLRKLGATYDQIAQQCGFSDRSSAYNAVKRELRRALTVPASDLRLLEAERLDDLWRAYIPKALRGDEKSGRLCLQIMERRAALLGLDAPKQEAAQAQRVNVVISAETDADLDRRPAAEAADRVVVEADADEAVMLS